MGHMEATVSNPLSDALPLIKATSFYQALYGEPQSAPTYPTIGKVEPTEPSNEQPTD